jgi:hypothetical protein
MLIKYVSFIVSSLITVSWASSSDKIEQTLSQLDEVLIKKVSNAPEISSELSYMSMPFDDAKKSYLWNPKLFHNDLLEALQALSIAENYNFPPYLIFLEFISTDSPLAHTFRNYIALNYCKCQNLQTKYQPLFWRSLVFSSFTDFSSISTTFTPDYRTITIIFIFG